MRVEFARTAIDHIAKIHDYIANTRGNPQAAKRVVAVFHTASCANGEGRIAFMLATPISAFQLQAGHPQGI